MLEQELADVNSPATSKGKVIIIGGGIIGLSSAFYLQKSGWDVTILEKGSFKSTCGYGSAGYICPSHFVPMATPGIVKKGLKWMLNSQSPFYVQPRLDMDLITWGLNFIKSAKKENVEAAAIPLRDIAILSKAEYESWLTIPGFDFAYQQKGLLEIFQTEEYKHHAEHLYEKSLRLGLQDTKILNKEELQALEPQTEVNAMGAILYNCDAHCFPDKLMGSLLNHLREKGVKLIENEEVISFEKNASTVTKIITTNNAYEADEIVLATGSWGMPTARLLDIKTPVVPGRGYSVTYEDSPYKLNYPAILMEGKTAVTPMDGNKIRFGGTMEITSHKTPVRMNRVQGILNAVKSFYPEFDVPLPLIEKVWYGYRPCSADGLPFLGRSSKLSNITVATGHSMLGLSLGAGTGKLVDELVNKKPTSMDLKPFRVERFQ